MTNWARHSIHSKCACRCFEPAFPIQPDWMLCRIAVLGQSLGRHACIPVQPIAIFCVLSAFPPKVLLSMVLTKVVQQSCRETGCSCLTVQLWFFTTSLTPRERTCAVSVVARSAQSEIETVWHLKLETLSSRMEIVRKSLSNNSYVTHSLS